MKKLQRHVDEKSLLFGGLQCISPYARWSNRIFATGAYLKRGEKALETLLTYNVTDTVNLETLMFTAYNMKLKETPFLQTHQLAVPEAPQNPFIPDMETIGRIMEW